MYKFSVFILIALLFAGCFTTQTQIPPKPKPQVTKPISKFIKGTIYKKSKEENGYKYEIRGTETSNGKLKWASATSNEECKVGDLVYAQIENGKITYLAVIIENYVNPEKTKRIIQTNKRDKTKKANITIPKEEKISF
ncbi:hypothetical protein [Campylobacter hyointestinalis]|uniref:hypothetical protein n=1 Tax=Campylobacter hyointestinalis TaxID=198 RepID=UPI00072446E0|nr:hypothetical protein [Campylobacter hyointestinalis]MDL2346519.1 hypothetical protein [Campylobacter hyointestinalis]MDL2348258.1 hypothetical protein [Campylobacter hyointestinalis]MDL2350004.1 hypothetical protein [Campylobacter hyointestinalis]MDM1025319.1 hypothetical protein [Campylobacter hyointestinalis]MDM1028013.1 hypothetical protein [Campylobacter hyointestinalis]